MADETLGIEKIPPSDDAMLLRPGYPRAIGYPEAPAYGYGYGDAKKRACVCASFGIRQKTQMAHPNDCIIVTTWSSSKPTAPSPPTAHPRSSRWSRNGSRSNPPPAAWSSNR